jgi:hypothetical protein
MSIPYFTAAGTYEGSHTVLHDSHVLCYSLAILNEIPF